MFPANLDPTVITVSERQRGNPVLRCIRQVRWVFGDVVPDYICGLRTCVLFLSLKYHLMFPEYIGERMREVGRGFTVRLVLCRVDVANSDGPLEDVTVKGILGGFGLVCTWSAEEGGRWLETLKACEHRGPDALQGPRPNTFIEQATATLTAIPGVNKTDVLTLLRRFKTLRGVALASEEELAMCPGIGPAKVARIHAAFGTPIGGIPTTPPEASRMSRPPGVSSVLAVKEGDTSLAVVRGKDAGRPGEEARVVSVSGNDDTLVLGMDLDGYGPADDDDGLDIDGALSDDENEKRIRKRLSKAPRALIVRAETPAEAGPSTPPPPPPPVAQSAKATMSHEAEREAAKNAERARVAAAEAAALRELIDADAWGD